MNRRDMIPVDKLLFKYVSYSHAENSIEFIKKKLSLCLFGLNCWMRKNKSYGRGDESNFED